MSERPHHGLRWFAGQQTPISVAVALAGAGALLVLVAGTFAVISDYGWRPSTQIAAAITSSEQLTVLVAALGLGGGAALVGGLAFRRAPTKPSREATISGAALGVQAMGLAALLLWFRGGDVETFARNFLEFDILDGFGTRFLRAALNTLILALAGEAIGIVLGLALTMALISTRAVIRAPARVYVNFFRGTPLLWQLSFFFFGIALGLRLSLGPYEVAILVIGLNAAAYAAEIFRAGIESVDRGQFEAARSLGLTHVATLRLVVLPQAVRRVVPPLTNEFVILIKDTSLTAVLGLTLSQQELMATGRDIFAQTFNATPFLAAAAGYLAVTLPLIRVVTWLERRLR